MAVCSKSAMSRSVPLKKEIKTVFFMHIPARVITMTSSKTVPFVVFYVCTQAVVRSKNGTLHICTIIMVSSEPLPPDMSE